MSRNILLSYPLIGAVVCLVFYVIARIWHKLQTALVILASGICCRFSCLSVQIPQKD